MFLEKYLDDFEFDEVLDNYDLNYLLGLDEINFINIYNLLKNNKFYFINDIIINFLEIFSLEYNYVENKILELKKELGENFAYIIGNDLRYLEKILDNI